VNSLFSPLYFPGLNEVLRHLKLFSIN